MVVGRACLVRGEAGRDKGPCVDALERDTCVGALAMVDTFVVGLFATVVVVVDVVVVVVVDVVVVVVVVDVIAVVVVVVVVGVVGVVDVVQNGA